MAVALIVTLAGCGESSTQGTEAATSITMTSTTVAPTSTAEETTTPTTAAPTTTLPAQVGLPADACDQIDTAALQEALGVASLSAGSPFSTSEDGAFAQCRFGITISGNLASSFMISMLAPSDTGAFEDALSLLESADVAGEPTELTGLGTRAFLYQKPAGGPLVLVEFENGAAAWAEAGDANVYVSGPADAVLAGIMDVVVGPILRAIP